MISSTPRPYYWAKYSWYTNADDNYASVKVTDPCGLVIKTYENVASNRILATAFSDSLNKELALQAKNINPPCPTESPYVTIPPPRPPPTPPTSDPTCLGIGVSIPIRCNMYKKSVSVSLKEGLTDLSTVNKIPYIISKMGYEIALEYVKDNYGYSKDDMDAAIIECEKNKSLTDYSKRCYTFDLMMQKINETAPDSLKRHLAKKFLPSDLATKIIEESFTPKKKGRFRRILAFFFGGEAYHPLARRKSEGLGFEATMGRDIILD